MKRNYNENIANAVRLYLDSINVPYSYIEDDGKFTFCYYQSVVIIRVNNNDFYSYAFTKLGVTEEMHPILYKHIHRISKGNYLSNFAYDEDEGFLICQCYTNCYGFIPNREIIEDGILEVALRLDSHIDIFNSIITKGENSSDDVLELLAEFESKHMVQ